MKIKILILFILFVLMPLVFVKAQSGFDPNTGLPLGLEEQISVKVLPKIPSPGEGVSIFVESFSTDLNKAYFTWRINGVTELEGNGETEFLFIAPESGESLTVSMVAQKEGGGLIQRNWTFSPADVDIIYEADTYTPPFYKGKPLFTSESSLRLIAIPTFVENGIKKDPSQLVYNWSVYGKMVYETQGGLVHRALNVEVEVTAPNSNMKAENSIPITYKNPELVIYENNPVLGTVFENAVRGNFLLNRPEVEFQAVPLFFSTTRKDQADVEYRWRMNGKNIPSGSLTSFITFRNDTGEAGKAIISLDAEHFNNILQLAQSAVDLTFEEHDIVFDEEENFDF
jgi:hypothetical protein